MHYRLAVEDIEPGHWIAWALDLPGCFSSAASEAEAIVHAPDHIRAYAAWLELHQLQLPYIGEPVETTVVETFRSFASPDDPDYLVNAFWGNDRRPLADEEAALAVALLRATRSDLRAQLARLSSERLRERLEETRPDDIGAILSHIATAENWYLQLLGLGLDRVALPDDPVERIEAVRANTLARLPELAGDERVVVNEHERWSARKVVRRVLWHERDHTAQIGDLSSRE